MVESRYKKKSKSAKSGKRMETTYDKNFINLQKKWYSKLKESGFQDIEWTDHSTGFGQDSLLKYDKVVMAVFQRSSHTPSMVYDYYYVMRRFSEIYEFRTKEDRILWGMFCEGLSYRKMSKQYVRGGEQVYSVFPIFKIIKRLKVEALDHLSRNYHLYFDEPSELEQIMKNELGD